MARIVGQREIAAYFSKYKTLSRLKISQITFFIRFLLQQLPLRNYRESTRHALKPLRFRDSAGRQEELLHLMEFQALAAGELRRGRQAINLYA